MALTSRTMVSTFSMSRSLGNAMQHHTKRVAPFSRAALLLPERRAHPSAFGLDTGVITCCLRTVAAIFLATTGFDRQQRSPVQRHRLEIFTVDLLSLKHQIIEWQFKQCHHFVTGRLCRDCLHGRLRTSMARSPRFHFHCLFHRIPYLYFNKLRFKYCGA